MKKKELEIIKQAIINEVEGYEFYNLAAKGATSKESEQAFKELAQEELKHAEYLKELFSKINNEEKDFFDLAWVVDPPSPKIFDWEKINVKPGSLTMSIFSIGMDMEKASVEFYENAKKNTEYEAAAKLYDILIGWEKVHLDQFMKEYYKSRDDWWNQQSFAPF